MNDKVSYNLIIHLSKSNFNQLNFLKNMKSSLKNRLAFIVLAAIVISFNACSDDVVKDIDSYASKNVSSKSTDIDVEETIYVPRCPGSGVCSYKLFGIDLVNDVVDTLTSSTNSYTGSTYQLYFYNEKVYIADSTDASSTGCPAIFMADEVSGIAIDSGYTTFVSISSDNYSSYVSGETFSVDSSVTMPLPNTTYFRWDNTSTLKRNPVKTSYYPQFLIGNAFQNGSTSYTGQTVYIIRVAKTIMGVVTYKYYAFMVYTFKTPGDIQTTTIKYKYLGV